MCVADRARKCSIGRSPGQASPARGALEKRRTAFFQHFLGEMLMNIE